MNGRASTVTALRPRSSEDPGRLIDELLRRALRIGDPNNPTEIAGALRKRYGDAAARIDQESLGMPVSGGTTRDLVRASGEAGNGESIGDREHRRVEANVRADLDALIDHPANREWRPELTGWRALVLREIEDGADAASFGQDPAQRERALLAICKLGQVARMARLIGVLHPEVMGAYRRLASSLDEGASVMRILIGESLYEAGLADGGFVLNVPMTDLRQRRDTLIGAVRRLVDTDVVGEGDWGEGLSSYGDLLAAIDRAGAPELKTYLREETLTRVLDAIVDEVEGATSRMDGGRLRELASTLPIEEARLHRLLSAASSILTGMKADAAGTGEAASVSADFSRFVQALDLFLKAFERQKSGARFIDLAVPLAMSTRQIDEADGEARRILRELMSLRGDLAQAADCLLQCCGCDPGSLRLQVQLDKVLHDVDRAIDLYALGEGYPTSWGENEMRAAVHGIVAGNLAAAIRRTGAGRDVPADLKQLIATLTKVEDLLDGALPEDPLDKVMSALGITNEDSDAARTAYAALVEASDKGGDEASVARLLKDNPKWLALKNPPFADAFNAQIAELILDRRPVLDAVLKEMSEAESDWKKLVETLAPRCARGGISLVDAGQALLHANPDHTKPFVRGPTPRVANPSFAAVHLGRATQERAFTFARDFGEATGKLQSLQQELERQTGELGAKIAKLEKDMRDKDGLLEEAKKETDAKKRELARLEERRQKDALRGDLDGLLGASFMLLVHVNKQLGEGDSVASSEWNKYMTILRDGQSGRIDFDRDKMKALFQDFLGWTENVENRTGTLRKRVDDLAADGGKTVAAFDALLEDDGGHENKPVFGRKDLNHRLIAYAQCQKATAALFSEPSAQK